MQAAKKKLTCLSTLWSFKIYVVCSQKLLKATSFRHQKLAFNRIILFQIFPMRKVHQMQILESKPTALSSMILSWHKRRKWGKRLSGTSVWHLRTQAQFQRHRLTSTALVRFLVKVPLVRSILPCIIWQVRLSPLKASTNNTLATMLKDVKFFTKSSFLSRHDTRIL